MSWFDEAGGKSPVKVQELLEAEEVWPLLVQIVQRGALLSIGVTSDGGALGITVTVDGRWRREYFREPEELANWCGEADEAVRQELDALSASSGRGRGQRRRPRAT